MRQDSKINTVSAAAFDDHFALEVAGCCAVSGAAVTAEATNAAAWPGGGRGGGAVNSGAGAEPSCVSLLGADSKPFRPLLECTIPIFDTRCDALRYNGATWRESVVPVFVANNRQQTHRVSSFANLNVQV